MARQRGAKDLELPWVNYLKDIEYIVYCRSSSDESADKQQSSIPQQIKACMEYAEKAGIQIAKKPDNFEFEDKDDIFKEDTNEEWDKEIYQKYRDYFIIKERKSAKVPKNRDKWKIIVDRIKKWKIRGVLSYSPDRTARNMIDGWEILNLVWDWYVKLEYTSFQFENNSSGRMLLWFWFVFSTMYSDKLGEDSTRGSKDTLSKGKALGFKHWYIKNEEGYHVPHPTNFPLICTAFDMKKAGDSNKKIVTYLINNGYEREYKKDTEKTTKIGEGHLTDMFIDSFYYGRYYYERYGEVDLTLKNPYYLAAVSQEDFFFIQDLIGRRDPHSKKQKKEETEMVMPFPSKMITTNKWEELIFYVSNKKRVLERLKKSRIKDPTITIDKVILPSELRYDYKWDDKSYTKISELSKERVNISFTLKDFEDGILEFLEKRFYVSDEQYESFRVFIVEKLKETNTWFQAHLWRIAIQEKGYRNQIVEMRLAKSKKGLLPEDLVEFQNRVEKLEKLMENLETERQKYKKKLEGKIVEQETFLLFLNNSHQYYKYATYVQKRGLIEKLVSNIQINPDSSLKIEMKPGLESLIIRDGNATENWTPAYGMKTRCPNH